jgi:predicted small metal-binding protein
MKTMTCAQMGGPCEAKITGNTPDEMMTNGMKHLESAHPEMAADMKAMSKDDPKMTEWNKKFQEDWANTPDSV